MIIVCGFSKPKNPKTNQFYPKILACLTSHSKKAKKSQPLYIIASNYTCTLLMSQSLHFLMSMTSSCIPFPWFLLFESLSCPFLFLTSNIYEVNSNKMKCKIVCWRWPLLNILLFCSVQHANFSFYSYSIFILFTFLLHRFLHFYEIAARMSSCPMPQLFFFSFSFSICVSIKLWFYDM